MSSFGICVTSNNGNAVSIRSNLQRMKETHSDDLKRLHASRAKWTQDEKLLDFIPASRKLQRVKPLCCCAVNGARRRPPRAGNCRALACTHRPVSFCSCWLRGGLSINYVSCNVIKRASRHPGQISIALDTKKLIRAAHLINKGLFTAGRPGDRIRQSVPRKRGQILQRLVLVKKLKSWNQ